jgi:hypothetical protein
MESYVAISGNSYVKRNKNVNYYSKNLEQEVIIQTWRYLTYNKNIHKYLSLECASSNKICRYENVLWRRWHIHEHKKNELYQYIQPQYKASINKNAVLLGPVITI